MNDKFRTTQQKSLTKLIVSVLIFLLSIVFLYLIWSRINNFNTIPSLQKDISAPIPSPVPVPQNTAPLKAFTDETYNFTFSYPSYLSNSCGQNGCVRYGIERSGNTIQYYEVADWDKKKETIITLTPYSVSASAQNDLQTWWKNHKGTEGTQAFGYSFHLNEDGGIAGCSGNRQWQKPPSLEVDWLEKGSPLNYSAVYFYYDFGKPFIMRVDLGGSSGACGGAENFMPITSLARIKQ